ncbi:MAG: hypothetical protein CVV11_14470 [Gammaproteobacteria bacterium HGW-Gammaproteobacteria-15]|nr:MAG: hypothetical protein CVV11_14470 [Gammaproteobacteria bacterium HGW-Gammaproteobacteria-15]
MLKALLGICCFLLSSAVVAEEKFNADQFYGSTEVLPVSLVQLIATPDKFLNKRIRVRGHFLSAGDSWLYLTSDHAKFRDNKSAINVLDDTETGELYDMECNNGWVDIKGYFLATFRSDRREIEGRLIVDSVYSLNKEKYCWERKKAVPVELLK